MARAPPVGLPIRNALPARVVVYYLLAMVLFFNSSYTEVRDKLVAGLDWARRFQARMLLGMQPTRAAITYSRQRRGGQAMQRLLEETAGPLAGQEQEAAFCSGMRLVAVDGMCLDLPDTSENAAEFGYPGNDAGRGPFPQVRVGGLGECGTRAVLGAELSPLAVGEQPLTRQLVGKLNHGDLLLADRNFLSHDLLAEVLAAGVHVLWRAKSEWTPAGPNGTAIIREMVATTPEAYRAIWRFALGVDLQAGGQELGLQGLGPAAVGKRALRGLGGEARYESLFRRHPLHPNVAEGERRRRSSLAWQAKP